MLEKPVKNRLLGLLSPQEWERLAPLLEPVNNDFRDVLQESGATVDYLHFPCDAAFSVLTFMRDGTAVEVATIGNEGFVGLELLVGAPAAVDTTICQVAGASLRMRAADFREAIAGDTPLRRILLQFLHAYLGQLSQSVACNRLHTIEERFSRWVLMTHDRVKSDRFYLTQEFLADMLGVHRPSVSLVAAAFQQAGMIRYSRGNLTILDRAALEHACCECYEAARVRFESLLKDSLAG
ncbi:Crp/Fnr family transcriptional regulator [Oxalobacteraceae bacterium OM1]|nr:Crp/Fnr family transcriptional regulator [Oxalobacteraceae bacterium OM1]